MISTVTNITNGNPNKLELVNSIIDKNHEKIMKKGINKNLL